MRVITLIFLYLKSQYLLILAQYITFDTGAYSPYYWTCYGGMRYSYQITFSGIFANPPQIIVTSNVYDTDSAPIYFTFDITNVLTTSFTFNFQCFYSDTSNIYSYQFTWVAVDDHRIEVISCFNTPLTGNKIFTFPHSNINALQGFVSMLSLGISGALNFHIKINSITLTQVEVEFVTYNSNLFQLGFQVILGTKESFISISDVTSSYLNNFYYSPQLSIPKGCIALVPYSGLWYSNNNHFRIFKGTTLTTTQYSYWIQNCKIQAIIGGDSTPLSISHQLVWMNSTNTKMISPFQLLKMSFTKEYLQTIDLSPWKVFISLFNQTFTSPTFQSILLQQDVVSLTVQFSAQCDQVKLTGISGQMMQCLTCRPQSKQFAANCSSEVNTLNYQFIFYQTDQIYQVLQLNVNLTGFGLYELAIQREGLVNYTIIDIQVVNY